VRNRRAMAALAAGSTTVEAPSVVCYGDRGGVFLEILPWGYVLNLGAKFGIGLMRPCGLLAMPMLLSVQQFPRR
jgi:hypothetical protein